MTNPHHKYLKQVKQNLPLFITGRKELISTLKYSLQSFAAENPDCTYEDYLSHFGTPSAFADELFEQYEPGQLRQNLILKKGLIVFLVILCLLVIASIYFLYSWEANKAVAIYENVSITELSYLINEVLL